MTRYEARWLDEEGLPRQATLEAPSRADALEQLSESAQRGLQGLSPSETPRRLGELAQVSAWLAELTRRGVPLGEALSAWQGDLAQARRSAAEGASLAEALACEGGAFASPHVQTLLRAAEGELVAEGLATLADVSSELERGRRVVTGELFYPALVASLGVLFMAGVLAFCAEVLPDSAYEMWRFKVTWVLELVQLTRALPWLPWLVAGALLVGVWGLTWALPGRWARSLGGARGREVFALELLAAYCQREVPMQEAWPALSASLSLPVQSELSEGQSVSESLRAAQLLSESEALGVAAAERAGTSALAEELRACARERLEDEVLRARRLGYLIELALFLCLGAGLVTLTAGLLPLVNV